MIKKILCIFISAFLLLSGFWGCVNSDSNEKIDNITYYTVQNYSSLGGGWIYEYNKQCENEEDKIEIVEFENNEALKNKLTTELMTGDGPDLIDEKTIQNADLSIEKLIEMGAFMDLNELIGSDTDEDKIDFSDYNQKALESGFINGKRFCIPLYYTPNLLLTTQQKYSKYINRNTPALSYNDMLNLCDEISNNQEIWLFSFWDTYYLQGLLLDYIDDNLDLLNKTSNFDTSEFDEMISRFDKLIMQEGKDKKGSEESEQYINLTEEVDPSSYIFEYGISFSPYDMYSSIVFSEQRGETPLLLGCVTNDTSILSANISKSIFVNSNSKKNEKLLKAIKYALSEECQNNQVGAEIEKYNPMFAAYTGSLFPVNLNSFNKLMNNADSFKYNSKDSYYVGDDDGIPDNDKEQAEVSEESQKMVHNALSNISKYELDTYWYYNTSVIGDLIESYMNSEIRVDKFVSGLKSKTKLYLEE
ncbi:MULTISPECIES: ABC transporter substrate-binding protein [unclassified Ruminococcus]|uniref:ABC transporter substrate-binding protein n=1 Tax=unclassified Ruminococcus TaxID=2608920 RepID=UPI00210940D2|nr:MULTISPECIES: ABC transporter substrate-binding protein [unclassified Ruminococcus]MCQ4021665.1 extracellular solute-binding protein [Ruminococcus sp. zg-924]MCQ4114110.1 extracellular solute-binding protein [Ruminococcus sp. zg-921]